MTLQSAQPHRFPVGTVVLGALAALVSVTASAGPASDVVEALHGRLLSVMQAAGRLDHGARAAELRPVLVGSYDLPFVSAAVLGDEWDRLSPAERDRFVEVFTALTVATYAARFDAYAGEGFDTVWERELRNARTHVRTRLLLADGDEVQLDYVLHEAGGRPRIINVVADGVSDLALKRAEYAAVIQGEGFEGLVARLARQTADFEGAGR